jgi:hypothetical protein
MRHRAGRSINGWYIWRGEELSQADDFFEPLHTRHLAEWAPDVLPTRETAPRRRRPRLSPRTSGERADRPRANFCFDLEEQASDRAGPAHLVLVPSSC